MKFINYLNENEIDLKSINVYLGVKKNRKELKKEKMDLLEGNEEKINGISLFFLKKISFINMNAEEKQMKESILKELNSLKKKEHKNYDVNKEKDKVITLFGEDLDQIKVLKDIQEYFLGNKKILDFKNFESDHVSILVLRIILTSDEVITFFIDYTKYNALLKINSFFLRAVGNDDVVLNGKNEKLFVIAVHPIAILFRDNFLILSQQVEKMFDFKQFYDAQIKEFQTKLEDIMDEKIINIKSCEQKKLLVRGIKEGSIEKFQSMSIENKKECIESFKAGYKEKYKEDLELSFDENKLKINKLGSKEKIEVFKLLADKSSIKILSEILATTID